MKDVLDQQLEIGDAIVLIPQSGTNGLSTGIVKGFTDTKVKVKIVKTTLSDFMPVCLKLPQAVCKVANELIEE